jgi:hypothetical protein
VLTKINEDKKEFFEKFDIEKDRETELNKFLSDVMVSPDYVNANLKVKNLIVANKHYEALTNMRTLLDTITKDLFELSEPTYSPRDSLSKKWSLLISKKILSKEYLKLLDSFLVLANKTHHDIEEKGWRELPGITNSQDYIITALMTGKTLLRHSQSAIMKIKETK